MSETPTPAPAPEPPESKSPLRRPGCVLALILWFALLLLPCPMFILATQGQISLPLGGAPGQESRLWLVMEADARGLGLSLPGVRQAGDAVCVQTDVRYFFWAGSAEPVSYCECYTRDDAAATWSPVETLVGACPEDILESLGSEEDE